MRAGVLGLVGAFAAAAVLGGPKLDAESKVKVRGSSVEYARYEPDAANEQLLIRRKARREMVNGRAWIFQESMTMALGGSSMLLQYTYQGVSGERRMPLDEEAELRWRGQEEALEPLTSTFEVLGPEGFEESCIWVLSMDDYLDMTDAGRFVLKTSRKKFTVSLSKDDVEAMRWAAWQWHDDGVKTLKGRYGKRYE